MKALKSISPKASIPEQSTMNWSVILTPRSTLKTP